MPEYEIIEKQALQRGTQEASREFSESIASLARRCEFESIEA
jgi:hypothetical protein